MFAFPAILWYCSGVEEGECLDIPDMQRISIIANSIRLGFVGVKLFNSERFTQLEKGNLRNSVLVSWYESNIYHNSMVWKLAFSFAPCVRPENTRLDFNEIWSVLSKQAIWCHIKTEEETHFHPATQDYHFRSAQGIVIVIRVHSTLYTVRCTCLRSVRSKCRDLQFYVFFPFILRHL